MSRLEMLTLFFFVASPTAGLKSYSWQKKNNSRYLRNPKSIATILQHFAVHDGP